MSSMIDFKLPAIVGIAVALSMLVDSAFASCVCPNVIPEEVVKHAKSIALVRVVKAEVVTANCGSVGQESYGIDVVAELEYFKGTGILRSEGRLTNTDPYFCGFSVETGDKLLDVEGEVPSLGYMTSICVIYESLSNKGCIERVRVLAQQHQLRKP